MDELSKLMGKKPASVKMSDDEVKAKMEVVMELLEMAQEAMGNSVKGGMDEMALPKEMSSVKVSAADPEDLQEGLETAHDMVGGDDKEEGSPEEESTESEAEKTDEGDDSEDPLKKKKRPIFNMF